MTRVIIGLVLTVMLGVFIAGCDNKGTPGGKPPAGSASGNGPMGNAATNPMGGGMNGPSGGGGGGANAPSGNTP